MVKKFSLCKWKIGKSQLKFFLGTCSEPCFGLGAVDPSKSQTLLSQDIQFSKEAKLDRLMIVM